MTIAAKTAIDSTRNTPLYPRPAEQRLPASQSLICQALLCTPPSRRVAVGRVVSPTSWEKSTESTVCQRGDGWRVLASKADG